MPLPHPLLPKLCNHFRGLKLPCSAASPASTFFPSRESLFLYYRGTPSTVNTPALWPFPFPASSWCRGKESLVRAFNAYVPHLYESIIKTSISRTPSRVKVYTPSYWPFPFLASPWWRGRKFGKSF